jgi:F0F1-type ATP synthase assembly protein I
MMQSDEQVLAPGAEEGHTAPSTESAGMTVFGYLLSGPLVYGGLGWLLDHWLGTSFITPLGVVGGMALAIYVIAFRYRTA